MSIVLEAWRALRIEGRLEPGWHMRRVFPAARCELFAGIHQPDDTPGLLLEAPLEYVPTGLVLPRASGFAVETTILGAGQEARVRFALALADQSYTAIFEVLCDDVVTVASGPASGPGAVRAWLGRLHAWQAFMAQHGLTGLTEAGVVGLIGELVVLRDHIFLRGGVSAGLNMWSGPAGEPNDFSLPNGFIEVKATARQSPEVLEIANPAQLDESRGQILLMHVQLRQDASGTTLPDLVAEIRSLVLAHAPDRLSQFSMLLMAAGYVDAQADLYPSRYSLMQTEIYRIEGEFPRIRNSELRHGIRSCRYVIDLDACGSYLVPANAVYDLIGDLSLG